MSVLGALRAKASARPQRILFPETSDPRVLKAAALLAESGWVKPVLLLSKDHEEVSPSLESLRLDDALAESLADDYFEVRKARGEDREAARNAVENPLLAAALLLKRGDVDGAVSGSLATTADVLRAGIRGLGTAVGQRLVSSFFLLELDARFDQRVLSYADCGVVIDPSAEELAEIALSTAKSHELLTGETPRVALCSFSTRGSASHARVDKVRSAVAIAKDHDPNLLIDGELQFDAAFVPAVANRKCPDSPLEGEANVFVFPDLDSGNIAYKITERIGGATALGPLIQGLSKPFMDLSRGCSPSDIADVAVVAACLTLK